MNTANFIPNILEYSLEKATYKWQTPSNIALVKYWGKSDPQIPKNASISFTLNNCHTTTQIEFIKIESTEIPLFELFFEGKKKDDFKPKIATFFDRIKKYCPYLLEYKMIIHSENSFPHSSGIASSASGMSAIAMCLIHLEKELTLNTDDAFLKQKASFLSRLGSGSASRSVEGPIVVWGKHPEIVGSSDLYGVKFPYPIAPIFQDFQDTILLVDKGEKQVSSTVGHNLMIDHPYAENRFKQANENLSILSKILQEGAIEEFIKLVESEALTLHAMMLTSQPYFILMKPKTLEIINEIWKYRSETKSNVCFTLDAGANVHLLYPKKEKESIAVFIQEKLSQYCQNNQYINDYSGLGSSKI